MNYKEEILLYSKAVKKDVLLSYIFQALLFIAVILLMNHPSIEKTEEGMTLFLNYLILISFVIGVIYNILSYKLMKKPIDRINIALDHYLENEKIECRTSSIGYIKNNKLYRIHHSSYDQVKYNSFSRVVGYLDKVNKDELNELLANQKLFFDQKEFYEQRLKKI